MKASGMDRMRRVLTAMKMTEMAQLGAQMRQVNAARQEANDLRKAARGLVPVESARDMMVLDQWQRSLEQRARAADARAEVVLAQTGPMRARLAETLGRENVTTALIDRVKQEETRVRDARAEDESVKPKGIAASSAPG